MSAQDDSSRGVVGSVIGKTLCRGWPPGGGDAKAVTADHYGFDSRSPRSPVRANREGET